MHPVVFLRFRKAKDMQEALLVHRGAKHSNRGVDVHRNYLALGPQW